MTKAIFQRRPAWGTGFLSFSLSLALLTTALTGDGAAAGKSDLMGDNEVIKVGQKAPPIETIDLEGKKFSLESFKGRPLLVDFGSVICEACGEMVKEISRVKKKYAGTDLEFVMIADGAVPAEMTRSFFSRLGATFTIVRDANWTYFEAYGVTVVPFKVTIDREGIIRSMHLGYTGDLDKVMDFDGLLK
jgi:peroxiredoxin